MPTTLKLTQDRSVTRLDLSPARSGLFTPGMESIVIDETEVQRFNALAGRLNAEMPALTMDQIAGVARRVLRTAAAGGESPFIRSRMRRAGEMRSMLADSHWHSADDVTERVRALLAYVDDPNGLFRDEIPVIGQLDDALLVDIAMDTLRDELDDYAEFRRYRHAEAARLDVSDAEAGIDRAEWQVERDLELRLERQLRRARGSTYAASAAERVFRVC